MPKTWLITGSSRGLGRAIAEAALDDGGRVVATARHEKDLNDLVERYGNAVRTFTLDVTEAVAARAAVQFAVDSFGTLDIVVNNAGYANSESIEDMPDDDFREQVEANFFGVVNVTKAALPILRQQRSGCIVQVSSIGGRVGGTPGLGAYQAAKFAVEGFSEVLNNEVKPLGIKVIIVEPGAFRTDWQGSSMNRASVAADYEQTVGAINRFREETDGKQPGDPARAAAIITQAVQLEDPPLRLLLGRDALAAAERSSNERAAEAKRWEAVSGSTDFSDQPVPSIAARG